MQTNIHPDLKDNKDVQVAEKILRSCVHCGFCTAVCPTYQELGDDLDSPRGRIYLIKNMLEEDSLGETTHEYLDRCLTCRSCETTCPSGVEYGRLLDVGRGLIETRYQPKRSTYRNVVAAGLRALLTRPRLFKALYRLGFMFRSILPASLRSKMPIAHYEKDEEIDVTEPKARALLLQGCVQRSMTPGVNQAIEKLLAKENVAVSYLQEEGCCGAVDYHLGQHDDGLGHMRKMVDRINQRLDDVDYVISSASGCGVTLKDYPELLADDPEYGEKAERLTAKLRDVSEVISGDSVRCQAINVAIHTPCTLQHGQKLNGKVDEILQAAGAIVLPVDENHLCCGSAGTYSVLQTELATRLGQRKIKTLNRHAPDVIVTANVGCQTHLAALDETPVMHWAEFLAKYEKTTD